jgi:hypothetical protein
LLRFLSAEGRRKFLARSTNAIAVTAGFVLIAFGVGEVFLRSIYRDGMSFGAHVGPIVERFERDFKFNRFDGPSRGPEVWGEKGPTQVRILFQGDSITWGQGVKDENLLYTSRLLADLRSYDPDIEAAVLAKPGRELDEHLAQLRKWGPEVEPDIIIYQWFINDMELNKENRPRRFWQNAFFHQSLRQISFLWFLVDYRIDLLLPSQGQSYSDYIKENFDIRSEGWTVFAEMFRVWAAEARKLTPKIIVMLYPGTELDTFVEFRSRMINLCLEEGIVAIDLSPWIARRFHDDYTQMHVSRFDSHPNALVHELMAEVLYDRIKQLWTELFAS